MCLKHFSKNENRMILANDGYALLGPNPSKLTPPEIHQSASPSCYFLRPGRDPPEKSHFAKIYMCTMVFNYFSADRGRKWSPPGPPLILRRPPRGGKRAPEKVRAGPPDPNGAPRTSSRAPGTLHAAPRGAQGGHGGTPGGPGGDTGGSLSFCCASPLILMVFSKCCCGLCFELFLFSKNLT